MGKLGNLIGKTIAGVMSIAATAVISVLVQRYFEGITTTPNSSLPLSFPEIIQGTTRQNSGDVTPAASASSDQPLPENSGTAPLSEVTSPDPLQAETQIDPTINPLNSSVNPRNEPSLEQNSAPNVAGDTALGDTAAADNTQVGISLEDPAHPRESRDSNIMNTFWDKLKNK